MAALAWPNWFQKKPARVAREHLDAGPFLVRMSGMVDDLLLADWVKQIEASSAGQLSPFTVLALAFLAMETHVRG